VLPCEGACAVREHIAYGIIGNITAVEGGQQIAPLCIIIPISFGGCRCSRSAGGISVFIGSQNIARIIVCPCAGIVQRLIILPDQLVLAVIDIRGSLTALADSQNVAVVIVGVGVGFGNTARDGLVGFDLTSAYLYYGTICKF